jgi:hypothetical protein
VSLRLNDHPHDITLLHDQGFRRVDFHRCPWGLAEERWVAPFRSSADCTTGTYEAGFVVHIVWMVSVPRIFDRSSGSII